MARLTDTVQQIGEVVDLIPNITGRSLRSTPQLKPRGPVKPAAASRWLHRKSNRSRCKPRRRPSKSPARSMRCRTRHGWPSMPSGAIPTACVKLTAIHPPWRCPCSSRTARLMRSRTTWRALRTEQGMVSVLEEVTRAIGDTRSAAGKVLQASETVETAGTSLQRGIEGFLGRVAV